ncbi:tetratricopeptide repeat protein [Bacillus safensis]|uniref:tetratricopeptide repeat protein n=1 Tax=Bacillus safensis TaxID=561879 RepID=UPI00203BA1BF|nr:tetratricopeptide repeat protein [Bacillus safensis]MCM3140305.1 tetratricopeptide repeat protein [Bacillus safensis]
MFSAQNKASSAYVAEIINEWNNAISLGSRDESLKYQNKVENLLDIMEDSIEVVSFFMLTDYYHGTVFNVKVNTSANSLKNIFSDGNFGLWREYYSVYFKGLIEFEKKQFTEAINFYDLAEQKLSVIPGADELKFADFHYKIAEAYYQIDQYLFSISHVEEARKIFLKHKEFQYEATECGILIGANMYDMKRFEAAHKNYQEALTEAKRFRYDKLISKIYHNLGLIHWQQEEMDKAIAYFKKALEDEIFEKKYGVQPVYMMSWILYGLGDRKEAFKLYEVGKKKAEETNNTEFMAKLNILYHTYEQTDVSKILTELSVLEDLNTWPDYSEITVRTASYFEENSDILMSHKFLKLHAFANTQIKKITEALA